MSLIADFHRLTFGAAQGRLRVEASRIVPATLIAGALAGALLTAIAQPAKAQIQIPQPQGQPAAPQGQPQPAAPQGQQPAPGAGLSDTNPGISFGAWTQRCTPSPPPGSSPPPAGKQEACFLVQQVNDPNTQRPVMKVTIGYFEPGRKPGAVVVMPLGVPLAHGVQISVDGAALGAVPFEVCHRDGCQALVPLSPEMIGAFKAGSQAMVVAMSSRGDTLNVPLSLRGFTAGFGSLE